MRPRRSALAAQPSSAARATKSLFQVEEHPWQELCTQDTSIRPLRHGFELGPLIRPVEPGQSIPLELIFVRGSIHTEAHVHSADG